MNKAMPCKARMRSCLRCRARFFSFSPAHRICMNCRRALDNLFRHYPESALAKERGRKYRNGEVMI